MKRYFLVFFAIILLIVPLSGCNAQSADTLLQNAIDKTQKNSTSSFAYTLSVNETSSEYLLSILGNGFQEDNERIFLSLSNPESEDTTIEMILVKQENTIYSRLGGESTWNLENAADNGTIYFTFPLWLLESEKDIQPLFQNPKILGVVEKNGVKSNHIQFDLNSRTFFELLAPGELEEWGDLVYKTTKADVYISRITNMLVSAQFSLGWNGENGNDATSIECEISFDDYNKAVTFPEY